MTRPARAEEPAIRFIPNGTEMRASGDARIGSGVRRAAGGPLLFSAVAATAARLEPGQRRPPGSAPAHDGSGRSRRLGTQATFAGRLLRRLAMAASRWKRSERRAAGSSTVTEAAAADAGLRAAPLPAPGGAAASPAASPSASLSPLPWHTPGGASGRWVPAPLVASRVPATKLYSLLTWLGKLDRFELVKSLRMASAPPAVAGAEAGSAPRKLTHDEIDTAVRALEDADKAAEAFDFARARAQLRRVLGICPNLPLALYRWGALELLREAARSPKAASGLAAQRAPDATRAFQAAVKLEPENEALRAAIQLCIRVAAGAPCPDRLFDLAAFPKSPGDLSVLLELARHRPGVAQTIAQHRRDDAASAAEARRSAGAEAKG